MARYLRPLADPLGARSWSGRTCKSSSSILSLSKRISGTALTYPETGRCPREVGEKKGSWAVARIGPGGEVPLADAPWSRAMKGGSGQKRRGAARWGVRHRRRARAPIGVATAARLSERGGAALRGNRSCALRGVPRGDTFICTSCCRCYSRRAGSATVRSDLVPRRYPRLPRDCRAARPPCRSGERGCTVPEPPLTPRMPTP